MTDEATVEFDDKFLEAKIRRIAREEIASLAGLVVRRSQDGDDDLEIPELEEDDSARRVLAEIFGEALNDFTTDAEPGPEPKVHERGASVSAESGS